jgi:hypothetical protein
MYLVFSEASYFSAACLSIFCGVMLCGRASEWLGNLFWRATTGEINLIVHLYVMGRALYVCVTQVSVIVRWMRCMDMLFVTACLSTFSASICYSTAFTDWEKVNCVFVCVYMCVFKTLRCLFCFVFHVVFVLYLLSVFETLTVVLMFITGFCA